MIKSRGFFILIVFLLTPSFISAACTGEQIDINTASAEELDQIIHVGNATAQRIINLRPFISLDDLDRVPYISPGYVEDIKAQGLACVDTEEETNNENNDEEMNNKSNQDVNNKTTNDVTVSTLSNNLSSQIRAEPEVINLNPKDIKSDVDSEKTNGNYAVYGLIAFSILITVLFMLRKNRYKNEFK